MRPEPRQRDLQVPTTSARSSMPGPSRTRQERLPPEEYLLLSCSPFLDTLAMESIATSLVGMQFSQDSRSYEIVAGRVDRQTHQIYGICREIDASALFASFNSPSVTPHWIRQDEECIGK